MIKPNLLELLIGIAHDETGIFGLTISFGGVLSELHSKSQGHKKVLTLPTNKIELELTLKELVFFPLFEGYRGLLAANLDETINVILKITKIVEDPRVMLKELEINPLIVTNEKAYAADALINILE